MSMRRDVQTWLSLSLETLCATRCPGAVTIVSSVCSTNNGCWAALTTLSGSSVA